MIPKVLKNFTAYVDGRGYAGRVAEIELPKLTLVTDEHRAGGMDAAVDIDMGMEKLEATATFSEYDPALFRQFGLVEGANVALVFRGAQQKGSETAEPVVVTMRGGFKELDQGSWKPGEKTALKTGIAIRYYKLQIGGETVVEIDIDNMKRIIGGVDQLASQRTALGI